MTLLEPQSRDGGKPLIFQVVCPQNGTAVLKGFESLEETHKLKRCTSFTVSCVLGDVGTHAIFGVRLYLIA